MKIIFQRALFCLLALAISNALLAEATIFGSAPGYEGKDLLVFQLEDEISQQLSFFKEVKIAEDGSFEVSIPCTQVERVLLRIGSISAYHLLSPDTKYQVVFPAYPSDQPLSFYQQNRVALQFINADSADVNLLSDLFDAHYDQFTASHYLDIAQDKFKGSASFKRSKKEDLRRVKLTTEEDTLARSTPQSFYALVDTFEKNELAWLDGVSASIPTKEYVERSIRYASGMLKMSAGLKKELAYQQYIAGQPIAIEHPDYAAFVQALYAGQLSDITDENELHPLTLAINRERTWNAMSEQLGLYDIMINDEHRAMAACVMLRQGFYNDAYSRNGCLNVLDLMQAAPEIKALHGVSNSLYDQLSTGMKGAKVANFTLYDHRQNKVESSDFAGKWVYLSFVASWSPSAQQELNQMKFLYDKFKGEIEFVTVVMDEEYDVYKEFVKENRECAWTFLYGGYAHLLKEELGIYAIPHFILVTPDGKRADSYTQKPSEGVGVKFASVLRTSR